MWRPDAVLAQRVVTVRVLSPAARGGHAVISYNSNFAKGLLAASFVRRFTAGEPVRRVADVAAAWAACGGKDCLVHGHGMLELYTA